MITIRIIKQDCNGRTHWRVMCGQLSGITFDHETRDDATFSTLGELSRQRIGPFTIRIEHIVNRRHESLETITGDYSQPIEV